MYELTMNNFINKCLLYSLHIMFKTERMKESKVNYEVFNRSHLTSSAILCLRRFWLGQLIQIQHLHRKSKTRLLKWR